MEMSQQLTDWVCVKCDATGSALMSEARTSGSCDVAHPQHSQDRGLFRGFDLQIVVRDDCLPAGLGDAGELTAQRELTQGDAREAELAVVGAGAAGQVAAVADAVGVRK